MYTNSDMTLYSFTNNGYERHYIEKVFWQDSVQKNTSKEGSSGADEVYICIPETDNMVFTVRRDIVVKGRCELEFDNTSDKGSTNNVIDICIMKSFFNSIFLISTFILRNKG